MKLKYWIFALVIYYSPIGFSQDFVWDVKEDDRLYLKASEFVVKYKWRNLFAKDYYYILKQSVGFTAFPLVAVYVIDNKVVKVENLHPMLNAHRQPELKNYMTMDEIFTKAQSVKLQKNEKYKLELNAIYGYPEVFEFWPKDFQHGEESYRIIDFGAIKPNKK